MSQFGGAGGSFGPNAWLVDDMYERFLADPESVGDSWREFFADYRPAPVPPPQSQSVSAATQLGTATTAPPPPTPSPAGAPSIDGRPGATAPSSPSADTPARGSATPAATTSGTS